MIHLDILPQSTDTLLSLYKLEYKNIKSQFKLYYITFYVIKIYRTNYMWGI